MSDKVGGLPVGGTMNMQGLDEQGQIWTIEPGYSHRLTPPDPYFNEVDELAAELGLQPLKSPAHAAIAIIGTSGKAYDWLGLIRAQIAYMHQQEERIIKHTEERIVELFLKALRSSGE